MDWAVGTVHTYMYIRHITVKALPQCRYCVAMRGHSSIHSPVVTIYYTLCRSLCCHKGHTSINSLHSDQFIMHLACTILKTSGIIHYAGVCVAKVIGVVASC